MKLFFTIAKAVCIASLVLLVACQKTRESSSFQVPNESSEERAAEILRTFSDTANSNEIGSKPDKSLELFFIKTGKAFASGNGDEVKNVFDISITFEMLKSRGSIAKNVRLQPDKIVGAYQRIADHYSSLGFSWDSIEIKNVKSLSKDVSLVYTRHWNPDDTTSKMRWWVQRKSASWQIFDYDELATNMRFSNGFAEGLNQQLQSKSEKLNPEAEKFVNLLLSYNTTGELDLHEINEIDPSSLIKSTQPLYHLLLGAALMEDGQIGEARIATNHAKKLDPDFPAVFLQLSELDLIEEEFEMALNHANQYAGFLGKDSDFYYVEGRAYVSLGRIENGIDSYVRGLEDDSQSGMNWLGLLMASESADLDNLTKRYRELNDVDQWVYNFTIYLDEENDRESLLALQKIHRAAAPDDDEGLEYIQDTIDQLPDDSESAG